MATEAAAEQPWYSAVPRSTRGATVFGFSVIAFTVLGFGVWGNTAPIAGAVVANGVFVATGENKIIQHLEGGVIRSIEVHEGDVVEVGQPLIYLDETAPRAELRRLYLRSMRLAAMDQRLQAETREDEQLRFTPDFIAAARDGEVAEILASQRLTFEARQNSKANEISTIQEGINALKERIEGSKTQLEGTYRQIALLQEEIDGKSPLVKAGLLRKPELLQLMRAHANLQGEVGRLKGELGDAKERISRSNEQIAGVRRAAVKTAVEQLHEIRGEHADVRERMLAAKGVLERVKIAAPVRGVVVKLRYHTSSGVIEPGKNIMELLPLQAELLIEARVRPADIDNVKRGQHAMVRLTALSQRVTPMIEGEVVYLSADALADERKTPQPSTGDIYLARVRLNPDSLHAVSGFTPTPGMPAEVYIKTAERTFFQYLMRPIEDSMTRAFRER
ncbi:HlyD family type I secretion periplasmic adaptor subunit [Terrarubrum flagellatum]|uniref:HlyD family type I secretion periplasmic adaptor subunit n=1 Tax=Terrirubrum flagellatum TaxID=2895980 RepID=UPI003144E418